MSNSRTRTAASRVDTALYALFSRHADRPRHSVDRERHRGAATAVGFETFLSRVYGLSWAVGAFTVVAALGFGSVFPASVLEPASTLASNVLSDVTPGDGHAAVASASVPFVAALGCGLLAKRGTVAAGGTYLRWRASARRLAIERSLPGAVRYLRVLADGSGGRRAMLRAVADQRAYGETSDSMARVLEITVLTGSLDTGIRHVARETPSRELLSPFLLKFRERAEQGPASLREYLRTESRMLSHRQSRARQRTGGYLELLAEVFILLVALPALLVLAVTVSSVFLPGLSRTVPLPGDPTLRGAMAYASAAFVLAVGVCAARLIAELRPPNHVRTYERPTGTATLATATANPASAAFVFAFPAVAVAWLLWRAGEPTATVLLLSYAAYGFPVGAVAVKRERLDDAKDRALREFVHAIAGRVSLGTPFATAVATVSDEVDFGVLADDIDDLAFRLGLTTPPTEADARREALGRFVDRVGTPLAEQTVGLVTGALDAGSDAETTFEALQKEVGSLYHQRKKLRATMLVYVVVGWVAALLVVATVVATDAYVLDPVAQLSDGAGPLGVAVDPAAVDVDRDAWRLYVVTQATMVACGWFAGVASRGRYEALLHSSALVVICYLVFVAVGIV